MCKFVASVALVLFFAAASVASAAAPAQVGPPSRITALGDSITRGYDSQGSGCTAFADCTAFSWATGNNTTVNSYLRRVQAINPSAVSSVGGTGNNAVTGAKVADLNGQAINAVATNPDLVLILIGANDVCTSSETTMTSVADFRTRFTTAMNTLSAGAPNARIMVSSIPNIYNLWNVLKGNFLAVGTWGLAGICQSMLASPTSTTTANEARRQRVRQRNIDFNTQLQQVCALYIHCRFDNNAAFNLTFLSGDVSTLDYFHPNVSGQTKAAATAWNAGPNYTDLTAPATTITRDHAATGTNDWYKESVGITLSATDPNSAVSGTEYFYKLQGAADAPWTKYTGPITISAEGQTEIDARSVDVNGNIEGAKTDLIKIDKTAPTFTLTCPASVDLNAPASITISNANDDRSGFFVDPDGSTNVPTSVAGHIAHQQDIQDQAGNVATHSCAWDVAYPIPGSPALTAASSTPNLGVFGLNWTRSADPAAYPTLLYTLQHRDADDSDWSDVASAIAGPSYDFSSEGEGTWTYRVKAHDGDLETDYSTASGPVKVDRSAPGAPTLSAGRAVDYAGGGGWFADTVTVSASAGSDPALPDGSSGSGVDHASLPAPVTHAATGSYTDTSMEKDNVGNESSAASLTVHVDATAPSLSVTCPSQVLPHTPGAHATVLASDGESGLVSDPSGSVAIDTSSVGPQTTTRTVHDNAGHEVTRDCTTDVVPYPAPGKPQVTYGSSPNQGIFALGWSASADPSIYTGLHYTLQHRDADDTAWTDVDGDIAGLDHQFSASARETEGTWTYRAIAHDGSLVSDPSGVSDPVKVDRTAPAAPTLSPDRGADYAGGGGWYANTVTVSASDSGDPALADGSDGTGVDLTTLPSPVTHSASGTYTDTATARDAVGNQSSQTSLTVHVDATNPSLGVTCPSAVLLNAAGVHATIAASDGESGLVSDPSGSPAIDTSTVGPKTTTRTVADNVGHSATRSCTTQVQYMFSGVLQPINPDGSSIFKLGSTVPVKFALTNAAAGGIGSAVASLSVAKVANSVEGTFVEATSTSSATTGSLFRYDATAQQYIFNLATKGLTTGTYRLKVTLDDGTTYTQNISLR